VSGLVLVTGAACGGPGPAAAGWPGCCLIEASGAWALRLCRSVREVRRAGSRTACRLCL